MGQTDITPKDQRKKDVLFVQYSEIIEADFTCQVSEEMNSYCELENGLFYWHMIISIEINTALQILLSLFFRASHLFKTLGFDFFLICI